MLIGYARLHTDDKDLAVQVDALRAAGCTFICKEAAAGKALPRALARCRAGDALTVWKLSRLGGSLAELAELAEDLRRRGAGLKVLTGAGAASIDTVGPELPGILAAVAEFEHERHSERTRKGIPLGRPLKLTPHEVARARQWIEEGQTQVMAAARLGVSVPTLRRHLLATRGATPTP